jgi:hypothetical protein
MTIQNICRSIVLPVQLLLTQMKLGVKKKRHVTTKIDFKKLQVLADGLTFDS